MAAAPKESASPWRKTVSLPGTIGPLANLAAPHLGMAEVGDLTVDPKTKTEREQVAKVMFTVVEAALEKVAMGGGEGYSLSQEPEPFFERTRTDKKAGEKISQRAAIAKYLDLNTGADRVVISEAELVSYALKAIRRFNSAYGLEDLIRDGIRRVAQELVTNAANEENSEGGAKRYRPVRGANWEKYQTALNTLKVDLGSPAWPFHKPYITLGAIASTVVGNTNVVQIRRWLDATGQPRVPSPDHTSDRFKQDPTLAGAIVDPQLDKA